MTELDELIEQHWCDDPLDTAVAVMNSIDAPPQIRELFLPLLRGECVRQARAATRLVEQSARQGANISTSPNVHPRSVRTLLDDHFYNGDDWVVWGDATVADHEGRIRYQQLYRAGIDKDISLHTRVIGMIKNAGVDCLRDVPNWETLIQDDAA